MRLARRAAAGVAAGALLAGLVAHGTAAAGHHPDPTAPSPTPGTDTAQSDTLRDAAAAHDRFVGTAVNDALIGDPGYDALAGGEFSSVTAENAMKWEAIQPNRGDFNFAGGDRLVDFADQHGQQVYGHTLVWHSQLPGWVEHGGLSPDELRTVTEDHISAVAGRYAGSVDRWDVVNEVFEEDGSFRESVFYQAFGEDFVADAFHAAHAADPDADLFINDYNTDGTNAKSDAMYDLVAGLVADGVPIDGVGFQSHLILGEHSGMGDDYRANLQRFADLGLDVVITELDIRMATPADGQRLQQQADEYAAITEDCLAVASCRGITVWGVSDAHSWIPEHFPGEGAANLWDEDFQAKPAYYAMLGALGGSAAGGTPTGG